MNHLLVREEKKKGKEKEKGNDKEKMD